MGHESMRVLVLMLGASWRGKVTLVEHGNDRPTFSTPMAACLC